jgi:hypothetical protein
MASPSPSPSLLTKTVARLRELARGLGVRRATRLAKEELVEVLAQAQPEASVHNEPAKTSSAVSVSEAPSQVTFLPREQAQLAWF